MVLFDQATYDKLLSEVPKYKLITPSILSDRLRVCLRQLSRLIYAAVPSAAFIMVVKKKMLLLLLFVAQWLRKTASSVKCMCFARNILDFSSSNFLLLVLSLEAA